MNGRLLLRAAQIEALQSVARIWPSVPLVLIGAGALACRTGLWWRSTGDLDLCVSLSLDAFPGPLARLAGWTQHLWKEHEWHGPGDVQLDVLPAGRDLLASGRIVWPRSGATFSLVGFRHVFAESTPYELAPGFSLPVATVPIVVLLKIVSYLDRPFERRRDVKDLAWLLSEYLPADDGRRWRDDVLSSGADYESASAFVLGTELHDLLNAEEASTVRAFLSRARTDDDHAATRLHLLQDGPSSWRERPAALSAALDAFEAGAFNRSTSRIAPA